MLNRRGLLLGLIAAPAIVKAASLMPVKVIPAVAEPMFVDPLLSVKSGQGWTFSAYVKDKAGEWVRVVKTFGENPLPTMNRLTDAERANVIRNLLAPDRRPPLAAPPWGVQLGEAAPGPGWLPGPKVEPSRTNLLTMSNRRLPDETLRELSGIWPQIEQGAPATSYIPTVGWEQEARRPDAIGVKQALIQGGGDINFVTPWSPNGLYVDEHTGAFVIPG